MQNLQRSYLPSPFPVLDHRLLKCKRHVQMFSYHSPDACECWMPKIPSHQRPNGPSGVDLSKFLHFELCHNNELL